MHDFFDNGRFLLVEVASSLPSITSRAIRWLSTLDSLSLYLAYYDRCWQNSISLRASTPSSKGMFWDLMMRVSWRTTERLHRAEADADAEHHGWVIFLSICCSCTSLKA